MELASQILSKIVVFSKYARYKKELQRREIWEEIIDRNKELHLEKFPFLKDEIEEAYQYVYDKKILPSMRSCQFAGKPIKVNPARGYNCCYLPIDDIRAFSEIMFLLLGGTGCGYSVQYHHIDKLPPINKPKGKSRRFLIGDSIEGWADAVKVLISSFFKGTSKIIFDPSDIRPKGSLLITSGGKAPGPAPLMECLKKIEKLLLTKNDGEQLKSIESHDIICFIADAVLSGGIRRASLISLFSADDEEMLLCKSGNWNDTNPQRGRANNSAVLVRHRVKKKFFLELWDKIERSGCGEPGIYFTNDIEWGSNPCVEIALRPFQFCNLTEINSLTVENQEDFNKRAKVAAFIGTLQASYTDFHYLRSIWKRTTEKDALIGVGLTAIGANKLENIDLEHGAKIVVEENKRVAKLIGINPAARTTCVKPSGTTSLIVGSSSGIHGWHDKFYIRRMRFNKNEAIYTYLLINHPELVEDDYCDPENTGVVSVPQKAPENAIMRSEYALSLLERVKHFSNNWVKPGHISGNNTHNVSATISIRENEWDEVGEWMWDNREYYNGLSVLPYDTNSTIYKQTPFESCDEVTYNKLMKTLVDIDLTKVIEMDDATTQRDEVACSGQSCEVR